MADKKTPKSGATSQLNTDIERELLRRWKAEVTARGEKYKHVLEAFMRQYLDKDSKN